MGLTQQLRVPLYADAPRFWSFDGFDDAIGGYTRRDETAELVDSLVVGAIDVADPPENRGEVSVGEVYGMAWGGGVFDLLVGEALREAVGDVLDQRAACSDRKCLHSAANAEYRHKAVEASAGEAQLDAGASFVDGVEAPGDGLSVMAGVNVECSACQHNAVYTGEEVVG